jgi:hypothetical protein
LLRGSLRNILKRIQVSETNLLWSLASIGGLTVVICDWLPKILINLTYAIGCT